MKAALIGYGKMGRAVETMLQASGDEAVAIRSGNPLEQMLEGADVAIDFSEASGVRDNIAACIAAGVPIVEGTTGWNDRRDEILSLVESGGGALVYGANFSIGVDIFYRIVAGAAELLAAFPDYEPFAIEQHHSQKKDAPSGTALKLNEIVGKYLKAPDIASVRAGKIPGTHTIGFDGPADQITLTHTARSREGFAAGAVTAARWIIGRKGVFEFRDVMDDILNSAASETDRDR